MQQLWTAVICLAVLVSEVAAQSHSPFAEATSAFSSLNFEGALHKLDEAQAAPGNQREDLVRIHALRALCLLSLGRDAEAQKAFRAVLSIDAAFRLGADVSPRYSQPFEKVLLQGVAPLRVDVSGPERVVAGDEVAFLVQLASDPAGLTDHLLLHYRTGSRMPYAALRVRMVQGKKIRFSLPAGLWQTASAEPIEWYCEVNDSHGGQLQGIGQAVSPRRIAVDSRPPPPVTVMPPPSPPAAPVVAEPAACF